VWSARRRATTRLGSRRVQALVSPTLTAAARQPAQVLQLAAAQRLGQVQPMAAARRPAQALQLVAAAVAAPQRS
jgi:hypothetical protein